MRRKNATSEFLKECMGDALLRLLQKKPLEQITISEITQLANVGRATFYRSFSSKQELLEYRLFLSAQRWRESMEPPIGSISYRDIIYSFFAMLLHEKTIVDIIYRAGQWQIILRLFYQHFRYLGTPDQIQEVYQRAFFSYGMFGITSEWILRGFRETPDEMVDTLLHGIWQVDSPEEMLQNFHCQLPTDWPPPAAQGPQPPADPPLMGRP